MAGFQQRAEYSQRADAIYVYLSDAPVARTQTLDDYRNVDFDAQGNVVGIEFLGVSEGIDLRGIPERQTVERLLPPGSTRVYA